MARQGGRLEEMLKVKLVMAEEEKKRAGEDALRDEMHKLKEKMTEEEARKAEEEACRVE